MADRAHVPPWALDDAPAGWVERVRMALSAENGAQNEIAKRNARQSKHSQLTRGR